jgi:acyl-ACP thioesterase
VPVEFVDIPTSGRVYRESRSVRLGDVDGRNEMHLEALGRFLQDAAADDVSDSGLPERGVWVVRRYDIELTASPGFRDVLDLATFCSGTGPCWAERRTSVTSGSTPVAEAAALWVYANRAGGRPITLPDYFLTVYGEAAAGRRVRSRLQHPRPGAGTEHRPWPLRARDLDLLDHVNNARALEAVQDEMAARRPGDRIVRASIEFRGALERDADVDLQSAVRAVEGGGSELAMWLVTEGEVRMSAILTTVPRAGA